MADVDNYFGPLVGHRRQVKRPHSLPLVSRTRSLSLNPDGSRVDGSWPNTVADVQGNALYVEHYLWETIDLSHFVHSSDAGLSIAYADFAIKLIISDPSTTGRQTALAVKIIPYGSIAEVGPTDFQQPSGSHWIENIAQMCCHAPDSPRDWQTCTVAPVNNKISWGGMFRPQYSTDILGMAFAFFFEGYTLST